MCDVYAGSDFNSIAVKLRDTMLDDLTFIYALFFITMCRLDGTALQGREEFRIVTWLSFDRCTKVLVQDCGGAE